MIVGKPLAAAPERTPLFYLWKKRWQAGRRGRGEQSQWGIISAPMVENQFQVVWKCSLCRIEKAYRLPLSTSQRRVPFLASSTMPNAVSFVLCDGCNQIDSYDSTGGVHSYHVDRLDGIRFFEVEKLFAIDIACDATSCEHPIRVYAPAMEHMTEEAVRDSSSLWSICNAVRCPNGRGAAFPLRLLSVRDLARL
jgi:hypothetical protein